tara:strand:- start:46902 stop:48425 length:1524 start_codon:yes stop_codon:yes gene_type:complete
MNREYLQFIEAEAKKIPNLHFDALRYILNNKLLDQSGLIMECGTWKGQTLDMISEFADKDVYGFDTFEGINTQWEEVDMNKFHLGGIVPVEVEQLDSKIRYKCTGVKKSFNSNVNFVKGFFQDTLPKFLEEKNHKISFLHIDCDIYESAKSIFGSCNKYLSKNSIIVFDELVNYYGFENGEFKAFYEWVTENDIKFEWIGMDGKVLSFDEIDFINNLNFDADYTVYDNLDWFKKARILGVKFSVAVRILKNPGCKHQSDCLSAQKLLDSRVHIVVPARYASSRFPGKALADICGAPMIAHVVKRCLLTSACGVTVATDDNRIYDATLEAFGAESRFAVVMTSSEHLCGTDRVAEVARKMQWPDTDFVVNVQGDEPLIPTENIEQVTTLLKTSHEHAVVTLCDRMAPEDIHNEHVCKVAVNSKHRAMLYTRAPIPCAFRALGIYGFTVSSLKHVTELQPTPREKAENVEPLRWLDHEVRIDVHECVLPSPRGVDTPQDLERLLAGLRN